MAAPVLVSGGLPPVGRYDADIIILTMGRVEATLAAVASAIRQQGICAYVAVLDQGGDAAGRARYAALFEGCECAGYFVSDINLGVAGGRNFLGRVGHGDVIVGLDNDAVFGDSFVAQDAVRIFRGAPQLGALAFRIMDGAGVGLDDGCWGYPRRLKIKAYGRFLTTTYVGAGYAMRRPAWEDVGGYDEALFFTWEEYEWALRAISRGWVVAYRGELCVLHKRDGERRVRWQGGRTRLFVRNRLMIARKWRAGWLELAPRIFGYWVKGVWNGAGWAVVRGVLDAVGRDRGLKKMSMSEEMQRYLQANEGVHRGPVWKRVPAEVFGRLRDEAG